MLTALIFILMPNVYETEVQILIEKPGKTQELSQQFTTSSFAGEEDYYGTQIGMLTGQKIADKIESEFNLPTGSYKVKAKRELKSQIITLTVDYKDPDLAAKIANRLSQLYMEEKTKQDMIVPHQILQMLPSEEELNSETSSDNKSGSEEGKKDISIDFLNRVSTDPVLVKLNSQRLDVEAQIQEQSQRYKWKHPVMLALNSKWG